MATNTNSHTASFSNLTVAVCSLVNLSWRLLPLWILLSPSAFAHGGHGNEFGDGGGAKTTNIQIDRATARQIGVQTVVTVTAPIDGTIADRDITLGQSVADAGAKLMTITDDRQVLATANIYERDLGRLRIGQRVSVKVPRMTERIFSGRIFRIGTAVDFQSRVVPVQATLDNRDGLLKAGTFVEIKLATDRVTTPVVVIPVSAVVEAEQEKLVYVKSGDGYQPTTVTLGQTVGDLVEVKAGLFDGDLVVSQRAPQLYAQSLKSKPAKADGDVKPDPASQLPVSQLSPYLIWGLLPAVGIVGGGAFLLGRRSNQATTKLGDEIEPAEVQDLPVLAAAAENNGHIAPRKDAEIGLAKVDKN